MISPIFLVFLSLSSFINVALAQLECPIDNKQTYVDPASQLTYVIECGYDRPGADTPGSPGWTDTLEECVALCSTTSICVDVSYIPGSPGRCYMKNALNAPVAYNGMMAAHLPSAEGPECPASSGVCLDVPDGGTCYVTECDSQRAGDFIFQVITTTFQDCIDECEANFLNGCTYVNFAPGEGTILPGGTCTLQSTYSQSLTPASGSWGAFRSSICPNQNGANETYYRREYHLMCGADLYGGDMGSPVWTTGIFECMVTCDLTPGCIAIAWHWGYPTGPCYLKSTVNPPSSNDAVNAAYWIPPCYSGISTYTTTIYTSTSINTISPWTSVLYTEEYQYNLQTVFPSETPITYGATPSPSTIPGGPQCYGWIGPGCTGDNKRAAIPEPTTPPDAPIKTGDDPYVPIEAGDKQDDLIEARDNPSSCGPSTVITQTVSTYFYSETTLSSTCTTYGNGGSTTVPAYCEPSFAYNLPSPPPALAAVPENNVSTAPSIITISKLDCCHACTRIFNCVWWNFEFGVDTPDDIWSPGTCTFAYFTGIYPIGGQMPAICPNGIAGDWSAYENAADGWPNDINAWYNTGYNPGACSGGALNLFESNWDIGVPPDVNENVCPGQLDDLKA